MDGLLSVQLFFISYNSVIKGPWEFSEHTADALESQMWGLGRWKSCGQKYSAWSLIDNLTWDYKTNWHMFKCVYNSALWLPYTKWGKSWKLQLSFQPFHLWKRQREIWCQGQKRESSDVSCSVLRWLQDSVSNYQCNWWRARACI